MAGNYLLTVLVVINLCVLINSSDVFTSTADMEALVVTEKGLTEALHRYLETEQNRLKSLKQFLHRTESTLEQINKTSVGKFVGNPINSYLMLKRFSVDWKNMENLVTKDFSKGKYMA